MDYKIGEKVIILNINLIGLPRGISSRYMPDDDLIGKSGTIKKIQGKYMGYDVYNVSIECGINPKTGNVVKRTILIYGICLTLQEEQKQSLIYNYNKNFEESEDNNMNQGIVEMWKEKMINKIKSDFLNQSKEIKIQDFVYSKKLELEEEMTKVLEENGCGEHESIEFKGSLNFKFYTNERTINFMN